MRQPNGCSTPAPKSSTAKQWIKELAQMTKEKEPKSMWKLLNGTDYTKQESCLSHVFISKKHIAQNHILC